MGCLKILRGRKICEFRQLLYVMSFYSVYYTITVDTVISQSIVSITFFSHKNDCPIFMDKENLYKIFCPFLTDLTDSHDCT